VTPLHRLMLKCGIIMRMHRNPKRLYHELASSHFFLIENCKETSFSMLVSH
jgi:hypothetical protein